MATNELLGSPADMATLISIASEIEGHPDNIAPALLGGFVLSSTETDGSVTTRKLEWPNEWKITMCVPDFELPTSISRSVLPESISLKDAAFNARRTAMMIEAIHSKDAELFKLSMQDKLHQPYRTKLVPGLDEIMNNLKHTKGVIGTVLCGAGPSVLIIYNGTNVSEIKEIVSNSWNYFNVKCNFMNLPIEKEGAVIL